MFKKAVTLAVLLLSLHMPDVYGLSAQSAVLIDGRSGRVLAEQNAYQQRGMASATKIMTAILALENSRPDDVVTVSYNAASTEGSSMYLHADEKIKMESLIYGLMLNSGNDAATAIAEHISGSTADFAKLMNEKARQLGLANTSFENPHGLDGDAHYTTAYDLAQLTRYAMQNETFAKIVSTKQHTVELDGVPNARYLTNHNKLLRLYEPCVGVKTGFTKKCGRCLVSAAEQDGVLLIAVTLNAPDDWNDHIALLSDGFNRYASYSIISKSSMIRTIPVQGGTADTVTGYAADDVTLALTPEEYSRLKLTYELPEMVEAPVYKDQALGTIKLELDGQVLASCGVVTKYGIERQAASTYRDHLRYLFCELLSFFL